MKDIAEQWPASEREMRPIASLKEYEHNSRTHSDEQIDILVRMIREFGWTQPVVVDENDMILAGHGRLAAARKLGITEVPVSVARDWSEEKKRLYVIADNQVALQAGWDQKTLVAELQALEGEIDLSLTGFDAASLSEMLAPGTKGKTDKDQAPSVEKVAITQPGDQWALGRHTLRCGSSTEPSDVSALLGEVRPGLMVTDPPYGVNYDPSWRQRFGGDSVATGKVTNDDKADWTEAWKLFPGDVAYVWHGALHNVEVAASLERAGFGVRAQIIWVKQRAPISRGHYHWQHEPALYAERGETEGAGFVVDHETNAYCVRTGKTANWQGDRKQTTVWFIEHLKNDTGHGTQKPVEAMQRPIENNSKPGEAIYEPFCGSGSTIIAGEASGRPVYAMEIDPLYCDVIVKRWQDFTGDVATDQEGRSFADRCL